MPEQIDSMRFTGDLSPILYQPHPALLRLVRLRWNHGPSGRRFYPLALNAGYHLLQLDADAHNSDTLGDKEATARVLKRLQEVRLLPDDELLLEPGDTLVTNQWEAWYPSTSLRRCWRQEHAVPGSESALSNWHSWRESILVWPEWPVGDQPERLEAFHPFLEQILKELENNFQVDRQLSPPAKPGDAAQFLQNTSANADPYGWRILQRLGLSVAFAIRSQETRELVSGQALLAAVDLAIKAVPDTAENKNWLKYLHVELLFQPSRRTDLESVAAEAGALLGFVQLSLRPSIEQVLFYWRVDLEGAGGEVVELTLELAEENGSKVPCSILYYASLGSSQAEVDEDTELTITLPMDGETTVLIRSRQAPSSVSVQGKDLDLEAVEVREDLVASFQARDGLAEAFASTLDPEGKQWQLLQWYVEGINSNDPDVPDAQRIALPTHLDELQSQLPEYLAWLGRFFDHGGHVEKGVTTDGPWLATAYPTVGTPAFASPDADGRLTYDHVVPDRWAHNYRYYIQPYGRYDQLWNSFSQAFADEPQTGTTALVNTMPDPQQGGVDVVLDRTQPVAMPVVLSSTRLDAAGSAASPAVPGKTWEVIVARHPEQALVERNQALVRRLSYRHIAFTLMRRFAYSGLREQLGFDESLIEEVSDIYPDIPGAYRPPETFAPQSEDDLLALDLPNRISRFQQGALTLQWEALPFYYQHQLLLVAQTSGTVSEVNRVVQKDFSYRAPQAGAEMAGDLVEWTPLPPFTGSDAIKLPSRVLTFAPRPLWESLPDEAQQQWPSENPDNAGEGKRKAASLIDPEVVYQIIETTGGNVELQAEIYFDHSPRGDGNPFLYKVRQVGRRFLAEVVGLTPPETARDEFQVHVTLQPVNELKLEGDCEVKKSWDNVVLDHNRLAVAGVLSDTVLQDLLKSEIGLTEADRQAVETFYRRWWNFEPVTHAIGRTGTPLGDMVPPYCFLGWYGKMSEEQATLLRALEADEPFQAAVKRLIERVQPFRAIAPPGPEQKDLPDELQENFLIGPALCSLQWHGIMSEEQATLLRGLDTDEAFQVAVEGLIERVKADPDEEKRFRATAPPGPEQKDLPDKLQENFLIGPALCSLQWHGIMSKEQATLLRGLDTDEAFQAAVERLIKRAQAGTPFRVTAPPGPEQVPDELRGKVTFLPSGGVVYETARWEGGLLKDREQATMRQWSQYQPFMKAMDMLLAAVKSDPLKTDPVALPPARPLDEELPGVLKDKLQIGEEKLTWTRTARYLSEESEEALRSLEGDDDFGRSRDALVDIILRRRPRVAGNISDSSAPAIPIPDAPGDLNIHISPQPDNALQHVQLAWLGRSDPDGDERDFLENLARPEPGEEKSEFQQLVKELLVSIDNPPTFSESSVPMTKVAQRPRAADLDPELAGSIRLEAKSVAWDGVRPNESQRRKLDELAAQGDEPFRTGMAELIDAVDSLLAEAVETDISALNLRARPKQEELPDELQEQFLIGKALLSYHGVMTADEAQGYLEEDFFSSRANRLALKRLYAAGLRGGMENSQLWIKARRGTAAPGKQNHIDVADLLPLDSD